MIGDRDCSMCSHYRAEDEYIGRCTLFHEDHYPSDGQRCEGWQCWEEAEVESDDPG